tara:strand:+ start:1680 stop:2468 length:789 start_codon:yes stop_codon:yes gene_type:complete
MDFDRSKGIGGSDAYKIMRGEWHELWLEKTGQKEPEDLTWVLPVQLGTLTEKLNIKFFTHETKLKVTHSDIISRGTFMFAHVDGIVPEKKAILECKHTNSNNTMENVINTYMPQVQHYLYVTGKRYCYLSVIFGNNRYEWCTIQENKEYQKKLIETEEIFWTYVTDKKEPEKLESNKLIQKTHDILVNDMRSIDFEAEGHNEFLANVPMWHETKISHDQHKSVGKLLKSFVPDDCRLAIGAGVKIQRSKAGHLSIKEAKGAK